MPKSSVSEHPSAVNLLTVPTQYWKLIVQHFYPNFQFISKKLSWKTSSLVGSEIFGLFFNTLAPYHMFSRQKWENFQQQVKTQLSSKQKIFVIFKIYRKHCAFWKKRLASQLNCFQNYWLWRMCLLEFPKSPVSEYPLTVNVLTGPKHCWNLNGSTFILVLY